MFCAHRGLSAALITLCTASPLWAASYSMTPLGSLGGKTTTPVAINASGEVVGVSTDGNGNPIAYRWAAGQMTSLGTYNGLSLGVRNVNSSGQIEGNLSNGDLYIMTNGQVQDIAVPFGGSVCKGYGFNDAGEITGQVKLPAGYPDAGQVHAFLYNPSASTTMTDLGTLGGSSTDFSYGSSINASGQIEGDSINSNGLDHAFIWTNGNWLDLNTFGGPDSSGVSINNAGHATGTSQVTGSGTTPDTWISHLFFYDGLQMHDCGTLGGKYANADHMNNNDQIVGYSLLADGTTQHAFYCVNQQMTDLNTLIPANSGWTLTAANGINDSGQIVATGIDGLGDTEAFLLNPIPAPEPSCMLLLLAPLLCMRRGNSRHSLLRP